MRQRSQAACLFWYSSRLPFMNRSGFHLGVLLVSALALAIYARRLDVSPPRHPDEVDLSRQAVALAQTGRDADGQRLPLYFRLHDNVWTPPVPVYMTAVVLKVRASASAIRIPSILLAAVDVALIALVAARLFQRPAPAIAAAVLLALTPSHFINGRVATASIYPIAFELVWLLGLFVYVERRQRWLLAGSTLSLGIGFYSHPVAVLMMPVHLGLTLATLRRVDRSASTALVALAGFAVPLAVMLPWFMRHHDLFRVTLGDWGLHTLANPRDGLRTRVFNWTIAARRISLFWDFFSPSYLFLTGGAGLVSSTQRTGLFLGVLAVPLCAGLYELVVRRWNDARWRLVCLGFILAPLGAAMFEEPRAAGRALAMLPFGILIAAAGFDYLLTAPKRALQYAAIAAIVLIPFQFYRFYQDYFGGYPVRAAAAIARSE